MGKTFKFDGEKRAQLFCFASITHKPTHTNFVCVCVIKTKLNSVMLTFIKYIVDCGNRWFVSHKLNCKGDEKKTFWNPFDMELLPKLLFSFDDFICGKKRRVISICCGFKFTDAIIYLCKIGTRATFFCWCEKDFSQWGITTLDQEMRMDKGAIFLLFHWLLLSYA